MEQNDTGYINMRKRHIYFSISILSEGFFVLFIVYLFISWFIHYRKSFIVFLMVKSKIKYEKNNLIVTQIMYLHLTAKIL